MHRRRMFLYATKLSKGINPKEDNNDTQKKRIWIGSMLPLHGLGWNSLLREVMIVCFSLVRTTQLIGRRQSHERCVR